MSREERLVGEGFVKLQLLDDEGNEIERREGRNEVVQGGMSMLARRIWSSPQTAGGGGKGTRRVQFMALGTDGTAPQTTDTDLITISATPIHKATAGITQLANTVGRTVQWTHTWTQKEFSAVGLEEVGLFNYGTTAGGTMFARFVFTTVNKTKSDTLNKMGALAA